MLTFVVQGRCRFVYHITEYYNTSNMMIKFRRKPGEAALVGTFTISFAITSSSNINNYNFTEPPTILYIYIGSSSHIIIFSLCGTYKATTIISQLCR